MKALKIIFGSFAILSIMALLSLLYYGVYCGIEAAWNLGPAGFKSLWGWLILFVSVGLSSFIIYAILSDMLSNSDNPLRKIWDHRAKDIQNLIAFIKEEKRQREAKKNKTARHLML